MAEARQKRPLTDAQRAALAKGRRFKPGQSGNPRGPKPGLRDLRDLLEAAMQAREPGGKRTRLQCMVLALAQKLAVADERAVELVARRVWPAPVQVELRGELTIGDTERDSLDARLESGAAALAPRANGHDAANGLAREPDGGREGGSA